MTFPFKTKKTKNQNTKKNEKIRKKPMILIIVLLKGIIKKKSIKVGFICKSSQNYNDFEFYSKSFKQKNQQINI